MLPVWEVYGSLGLAVTHRQTKITKATSSGALPRTPLGSLQRSQDSNGGKGAYSPIFQNPIAAIGPWLRKPMSLLMHTTLTNGCPRPSAGKKRWELCTTYRVTVYWLCEQNKTWPSALLHSTTCNDIKAVHDQLRIVRPHRSTTCIDAAYCYTAWSVCLSVCLSRSWALQKNA